VTVIERPGTSDRAGRGDEPGGGGRDQGRAQGRPRKRNVVAEIAERRRIDVREEMASLTLDDHLEIAAATRPPRPILDRLAAPGLHVIAEIKRSSPSAGAIAASDEDIVARARAY
jgi:Indole-3-glycerol phosphate synthase